MVFLIQHTQTRDTLALQLKLDELIIATKGARNSMACIEEASKRSWTRKRPRFARAIRRGLLQFSSLQSRGALRPLGGLTL
jgi:low affinity Fe/Cu permease